MRDIWVQFAVSTTVVAFLDTVRFGFCDLALSFTWIDLKL